MSQFWLISVPGEAQGHQAFEKLNAATASQGLSVNSKFPMPDLKVGTLDILVGLSDELCKLDTFVESVAVKVARYAHEIAEDRKDKAAEILMANGNELPVYLQRFQWDLAKYPVKQPLKGIADIINKQVAQIDADLKTRSHVYNNLKSTLQMLERKTTGSLLTRNLGELVKKEHFVVDSEYLVTLLIVVPHSMANDWRLKYEKLTDMVVPRSSRLLHQDNDHALFNVTVFRRVVDEFRQRCRENRFIVREFIYNESDIENSRTELSKVVADKQKYFGPLWRWLKVNFGETFTAWVHVKALRIFVESVLRYGLPVNFQAVIMRPGKKSQKRLRELLNAMYSHLDSSSGMHLGVSSEPTDIPGLSLSQLEYYPYVYHKIDIDLVKLF